MIIERVAEHSFCPELMPEKATILDIGCIGFVFSNEMKRLGHTVHCVDIQELKGGEYHRLAITDYNGFGYIIPSNDKQAFTFIKEMPLGHLKHESVLCVTLELLMGMIDVPSFFDLIKMDIEGSEYQVIMSLTEPPAKQLSIEFHLHTGVYSIQAVAEMRLKLFSLGYIAVQHELTEEHGCGKNYWDSVFVLMP